MRALLHLVSLALVMPVLGLAAMFTLLGHVIAAGSLLKMFDQLVADAVWLMPWGLLAASGALVLIALGGLLVRTRWLAGSCIAVLGVLSTGVVLFLISRNDGLSLGQWLFFVPGLVGAGIGLWFALTERPTVSGVAPAPAPAPVRPFG